MIAETLHLGITQVKTSTVGGLSAADLLSILSIIVFIFGMLLTAIGVLVLRSFNGLDRRITEVKADAASASTQLGAELRLVWASITALRWRLFGETERRSPGPPGL